MDPSQKRLTDQFNDARAAYEKLWRDMEPKLREEMTREVRHTITVLRARRDGKRAELRKAEAARDGALNRVTYTQKLVDRNTVSKSELEIVATALRVAEAEVDVRKAALDEAEAELEGAEARLGADPAPASTARVPDPDAAANIKASRAGKLAELHKAEAVRDVARAAVVRNRRYREKGKNLVSDEDADRAEADLRVAEAEVEIRQAALAEIDLQQGKGQPGSALATPPAPVPEAPFQGRSAAPARFVPDPESRRIEPPRSVSNLADLRDEAELADLRVQQNETNRREAEETLARVERERKGLRSMITSGDHSRTTDLDRVQAEELTVEQRVATLREAAPELKLKATQAKRRVDGELARVRRDAEQAKGRLRWVEGLQAKGYISPSQLDEYRNRYDDLMTLIDPDHKPTPSASPKPEDPSPAREGP